MIKTILLRLTIYTSHNSTSRNLQISHLSKYSTYFEKNINIIIILLFGFILIFNFLVSLNFKKKKTIIYNLHSNTYNIKINRPSHIALLLLLISYAQFISALHILDLNIFTYPNLYNISRKLDWLNLWNINIIKTHDKHCHNLNFFFQNHFTYIVGLVGITIINIVILLLFNLFYKAKIIYINSDSNIVTLGFINKISNYIKKKNTVEDQEIQNNIIIPTKSNYNDFNIIIKNNYIMFPYMQISWTQFALLGLITSEFIMFKKNCLRYIIVSLGAFIILPTLYITYITATIYNKIKCREDLNYITEISNNLNKKKYIIDLFNRGFWFSQKRIKFYKSHSPIYIDFIRKNIHYNIFNFIKITILAFIIAQNNTKNINIIFYIISILYVIDTIIMLILRPFKNNFIATAHILTNISCSVSLMLLIYTKKDIYTMYIVDYTFLSLIVCVIIDFIIYNISSFCNFLISISK